MKKAIPLSLILCLMISCSGGKKHYAESDISVQVEEFDAIKEAPAEQAESYESEMRSAVTSSAAKIGKQDSTRKLIRTAELKFKAKNVTQSVYIIEDIVNNHDGFISDSNLTGEKNKTEEVRISKDSTLILTHYTVTNQMVIRIPNVKLDTVLKDIAKQIAFLDYRTIKADDATLTFMANQLAQKRNNQSAQRVKSAIDNRGRRLNETVNAEDFLSDKEQYADNAYLSNLSLMDRVAYSTIKLHIYQQESVFKELTANTKNIDAYQPGFGRRLLNALSWGGNVLLDIIVLLVNIWPFIVIPGIVWFAFRWWRKRRKEKK